MSRGLALVVAGLALAAMVAWAFLPRGGFFPESPKPGAVYRVEIAHGRKQVVLERKLDTGQWVIASADAAPADAAKVQRLVSAVLSLRPGDPVAVPDGEPVALRLSDRNGEALAFAGVWNGVLRRLPDGPAIRAQLPEIELEPSAWSTLAAPRIGVADVVGGSRFAADGEVALDPEELQRVMRDLAAISSAGWRPARELDWTGAAYVQLRLADGRIVEMQQTQDVGGNRYIRLTAEADPALRALRFFAFPVAGPEILR
jgi:hypothetical protein